MSGAPWSEMLSKWRVPLSFAAAALYFLLSRPTFASIVFGSSVALLGLMWRLWASGTIRKIAALESSGPYALSRNPLYFGSFLIALGFAIASHHLAVVIGIVVFFAAVYGPVMRREERDLRQVFGDDFDEFARRVPLFVPWKWPGWRPAGTENRFNWGQYRRNREYNALLGFCGAVALLFLIKYLRGI